MFRKLLVVAGLLGVTGAAFAVDPTTPTEMVTAIVTEVKPMMLGVGGALGALIALAIGIGLGIRLIRKVAKV